MDTTPPLAERRKGLGLTQTELADLLGVNQATVSRNENSDDPDKRYCLALEALEARKATEASGHGRKRARAA